jgi:hypothetical protein
LFTGNLRTDTGFGLKYGSFVSTSGYLNLFAALGGSTMTLNIKEGTGGFESALQFNNTANRSYAFPNANGTIALTNDLSSYLPLAGGTLTGALGINSTSLTGYSFRNSRNLTGTTFTYANYSDGQIQTDATGISHYFYTEANVAAGASIAGIYHFKATQNLFGAGSFVGAQAGLVIDFSLSGASVNYGIISNITDGTDNWNLYIGGGAKNYIAGSLGIATNTPEYKLDVIGTGRFTNTLTAQSGIIFNTSQTINTTGSIGYNSTQGLFIYTRTGSAYDFKIYNGAGSTFMQVPTGTQNVEFLGSVNIGTGNLAVGTISPFSRLHVQDSNVNTGTIALGSNLYPSLIFSSASSGEYRFDNRTSFGGFITFYPNGQGTTLGNEAMRITSSRNLTFNSSNVPSGIVQEVGGETPLLGLDVNFRPSNLVNTVYAGAQIRIDMRSGQPAFSFLYRQAGSIVDSVFMKMSTSGNFILGNFSDIGTKLQVNGANYIEMATFACTTASASDIVSNNSGIVQFSLGNARHCSNTDLFVPVSNGIQINKAGIVHVSFSQDITTAGATGYVAGYIRKNGTNISENLITNTDSQWDGITGVTTISVNASDVIGFSFNAAEILAFDPNTWSNYSFIWSAR